MDQFIRGLGNETLQTDILAKASQLKTFEEVVKHAEGFEAAQRDQSQLQTNPEVLALRSSMYQQKKKQLMGPKGNNRGPRKCPGCGSTEHGQWNANDRAEKCPAWGKECEHCGKMNHFRDVCRTRGQAEVHGIHQETLDTNSSADTKINIDSQVAAISADPILSPRGELLAQVSLKVPRCNKETKTIPQYTYPDSGANICVGGPQHLAKFNLSIEDLIPPGRTSKFSTSSGESVVLIGWLPAKITIGNNVTSQPFYISRSVDRIYLSSYALIDLNILPPTYPLPMDHSATVRAVAAEPTEPSRQLPERPEKLPFAATEENIPKLKDFLIQAFADTAFNAQAEPFPCMSGPPAHIHLKEGAQPYARHSPIPIPLNWKKIIKEYLDDLVRRGIIIPVPIGMPVIWCALMVIIAKKNGKP